MLNSLCRCMTAPVDGYETTAAALAALDTIRSECTALHSVLLPVEVWPKFKAWHGKPDAAAFHCSMLLLALKRGHLKQLTHPIHRYLIKDSEVRADLRLQYVKDLPERWMYYDDALERHQKSRIFTGRIVELQCAEWLEAHDWTITALDALQQGPDIEARDPSGCVTAFEVKFIGTQDGDFTRILNSIASGPSWGGISAYSGINYLLFRLYQAAKQLGRFDRPRIAVAVIDDSTWRKFKVQLKNGWLDLRNPRFLGSDPGWEEFIAKQERRYPELRVDLAPTLGALDAAWVFRQRYGYEYSREYVLPTRNGSVRAGKRS